MRDDFNKVITERERRGSSSRNLKTGFSEHGYDDREIKEDKYSLPKKGKMLMHNRDLGTHDESKDFTDVLGPLNRWLQTRVGKNWDKTYSEVRKKFPNNNKVNHHLLETHLLRSIELTPRVERDGKIRRVYDNNERELWKGELYVDPVTHVLMKYKWGRGYRRHPYNKKPVTTLTGYHMYTSDGFQNRNIPSLKDIEKKEYYIYTGPHSKIEWHGNNWVYIEYKEEIIEIPHERITNNGTVVTYSNTQIVLNLIDQHVLSKKELIKYGLKAH
jgi:hypothetical protein